MARRKRIASDSGSEDDVNLTPMLDVVFILLIFFIVTSKFIKEPGVDVIRPEVETKKLIEPLGILIAIDENSSVWIDKKEVPLNEVSFQLKELRSDNKKGKIVVQTDVDSNAEVLVEVMEVINNIDGATAINISADQG